MIFTITRSGWGQRLIVGVEGSRIGMGLLYFLVMLTPGLTYAYSRDTVAVCGPRTVVSKVERATNDADYVVVSVSEEQVSSVSPDRIPLLILASQRPLPPVSLIAIDQYVRSGGNVIVLDPRSTSMPIRAVAGNSLADYHDKESYRLAIRADGVEEKPDVTPSIDQQGYSALRFQTFKRGTNDVRLTFDCSRLNISDKQLIRINAKGDAYMDLLYIEATDNDDRTYCTFLPVNQVWQTYSIPLGNLISTTAGDTFHNQLRPQNIKRISIGTNRKTIWPEKPMTFSIGRVDLARNYFGTAGPTALLNRLAVPFKEIGLKPPVHVFSPFYGSKEKHALTLIRPGTPSGQFYVDRAWICPSPFNDFPGIGMGTDHKPEFDTHESQSVRRVPLLEVAGSDQAAAELRYYAGGRYKGSAVAIFGLDLEEVFAMPWFWSLFHHTVHEILEKPHIYRIQMNTVPENEGASVVPLFRIKLGNPLKKKVLSDISVHIGTSEKELSGARIGIVLEPDSLSVYDIVLDQVPEGFDFRKFNWSVTLHGDFGEDIWRDSVDVERIVLQAGLHMIQAQKWFPDGRISNHYFADAYGARALFAYFRYLLDHPEHLQFNKDLWQQVSPEQFKHCAERFCDMLVRRQALNGAVPMGYSEQSGSFNVADGGQISLGLAEVGLMVEDSFRYRQYITGSRKIIDYAESFYIDSALFHHLARTIPKKVRSNRTLPGFYGLGIYSGGIKKAYGPVWVLSDILSTQALLSFIYPEGEYRTRLKRNVNTYLDNARVNSGWYQAEAMIWSWYAIADEATRTRIRKNLTDSFLPTLFSGKPNDMYDFGARGSLRALPLLYYRQLFGDSPSLRAAVLKYLWTAGSETCSNSIAGLRKAYPVPHHGASLAAIKFSEFSSIWAMELLDPGSTLIKKSLY